MGELATHCRSCSHAVPTRQEAGSSGVSGVEIRSAGQQAWTKMDSAWGANWQTSSAGAAPFDLRLTPRDGSPQLVALCAHQSPLPALTPSSPHASSQAPLMCCPAMASRGCDMGPDHVRLRS